jgi:hypothetical protein
MVAMLALLTEALFALLQRAATPAALRGRASAAMAAGAA